jgi:hypothetical protein
MRFVQRNGFISQGEVLTLAQDSALSFLAGWLAVWLVGCLLNWFGFKGLNLLLNEMYE